MGKAHIRRLALGILLLLPCAVFATTFVAVGINFSSVSTDDGVNWTKSAAGSTFNGHTGVAVTYGAGTYCSLLSDTGTLSLSSTDGLTWASSSTAVNGVHKAVTYSTALSLFISTGSNLIETSPTCSVWTSRTVPGGSPSYAGAACTSTLCALVGGAGVNANSSNGTAWTSHTAITGTGTYTALATDGTTFCAVGTSVAASSTDGATWTVQTIPAGSYTAVAWSSTLALFVATGSASVAASSPDCVTWTTRTITTGSWSAVAWNGVVFCSTDASVSSTVGTTSSNGTSWTQRTTSALNTKSITAAPASTTSAGGMTGFF